MGARWLRRVVSEILVEDSVKLDTVCEPRVYSEQLSTVSLPNVRALMNSVGWAIMATLLGNQASPWELRYGPSYRCFVQLAVDTSDFSVSMIREVLKGCTAQETYIVPKYIFVWFDRAMYRLVL